MTPKLWAQKRNWSKAVLTNILGHLQSYGSSPLMTRGERIVLKTAAKEIETILLFWPEATKLSRKENVK